MELGGINALGDDLSTKTQNDFFIEISIEAHPENKNWEDLFLTRRDFKGKIAVHFQQMQRWYS